jgi:carboxyl-terminal processing protease
MKLSRVIITLLAAMGIYVGSANAQKAANENIESVSPQEFNARLQTDTAAYLLDARTSTEFAAGHLKGAHQLNWLDSTVFNNGAKQLDKSKTIYVYCRSGHRSGLAARYLAANGFRVVDMTGGYIAWTANGLETEK